MSGPADPSPCHPLAIWRTKPTPLLGPSTQTHPRTWSPLAPKHSYFSASPRNSHFLTAACAFCMAPKRRAQCVRACPNPGCAPPNFWWLRENLISTPKPAFKTSSTHFGRRPTSYCIAPPVGFLQPSHHAPSVHASPAAPRAHQRPTFATSTHILRTPHVLCRLTPGAQPHPKPLFLYCVLPLVTNPGHPLSTGGIFSCAAQAVSLFEGGLCAPAW